MTRKILIALVLTLVSSAAFAQQPTQETLEVKPSTFEATPEQVAKMNALTAPVLTDAQKMQLMLVAKDVEIWTLKARVKATVEWAEAEKAQQQLQQLIAAMTPEGYTMNEKMEFVKNPPQPAAGR